MNLEFIMKYNDATTENYKKLTYNKNAIQDLQNIVNIVKDNGRNIRNPFTQWDHSML